MERCFFSLPATYSWILQNEVKPAAQRYKDDENYIKRSVRQWKETRVYDYVSLIYVYVQYKYLYHLARQRLLPLKFPI